MLENNVAPIILDFFVVEMSSEYICKGLDHLCY